MATDRAKREREVVRAVWAVTLALVVGSFGFVIYAGGPSTDETIGALVEPPSPAAPAVARVPVTPTVVSRPTSSSKPTAVRAAASAPGAAAQAAGPKTPPAPWQWASAPGVAPAPAPAPRRVVVVRRSRAS